MKNPLKGVPRKTVQEAIKGYKLREGAYQERIRELEKEWKLYTNTPPDDVKRLLLDKTHDINSDAFELDTDYVIGKINAKEYAKRTADCFRKFMDVAVEELFVEKFEYEEPEDEEEAIITQCFKSNFQSSLTKVIGKFAKEVAKDKTSTVRNIKKSTPQAIGLSKKHGTDVKEIYKQNGYYKELITSLYTRDDYAALLEKKAVEQMKFGGMLSELDITRVLSDAIKGTARCVVRSGAASKEESKEVLGEVIEDLKKQTSETDSMLNKETERIRKGIEIIRRVNYDVVGEIFGA